MSLQVCAQVTGQRKPLVAHGTDMRLVTWEVTRDVRVRDRSREREQQTQESQSKYSHQDISSRLMRHVREQGKAKARLRKQQVNDGRERARL